MSQLQQQIPTPQLPEFNSVPIQAQRNPFFSKPETSTPTSSSSSAAKTSSSSVNPNAPLPPHFQYFPLHPSLSSLPHIYHPAFGPLNPPQSELSTATAAAGSTSASMEVGQQSQLSAPQVAEASTDAASLLGNERLAEAQPAQERQQTASSLPSGGSSMASGGASPAPQYAPYIFPHYLPFPYSPFAWPTMAQTSTSTSSASSSSSASTSSTAGEGSSSSSSSSTSRRQQAAASAAAAAFPPAMLLPSQFFHAVDPNQLPSGTAVPTPATMSMAALDAYAAAAAAAAVASANSASSASRNQHLLQNQQNSQQRSHHNAFKRTASVAFKNSGSGGSSSKRHHHNTHHHRERQLLLQQQQQQTENSLSGSRARHSRSFCPGHPLNHESLMRPEASVSTADAQSTNDSERIPQLVSEIELQGQEPSAVVSANEDHFMRPTHSQNRPAPPPSVDAATAAASGDPISQSQLPLPPNASALSTGSVGGRDESVNGSSNSNISSGNPEGMSLSGTAAVATSTR